MIYFNKLRWPIGAYNKSFEEVQEYTVFQSKKCTFFDLMLDFILASGTMVPIRRKVNTSLTLSLIPDVHPEARLLEQSMGHAIHIFWFSCQLLTKLYGQEILPGISQNAERIHSKFEWHSNGRKDRFRLSYLPIHPKFVCQEL